MVLREYLSIRRAYNLVRQDVESARRLSFAEFAILCRLSVEGQSLRTSDIAEYQGSLRPTMTHRTKHLAALGFLAREKGGVDRRNVICSITDEGRQYVEDLCAACREAIPNGQSLSRTSPVVLTDEGWERADALNGQIERLVVHRRPRASK